MTRYFSSAFFRTILIVTFRNPVKGRINKCPRK